jgi:hypothetical protein
VLMLSEIIALADRTAELRREAVADDELLDLIEPATPDRVAALDDARSVFLIEWWVGNSEAEILAREEIAALAAAAGVVPLTGGGVAVRDDEYVGFLFCLALTPDTVSEATN